MIKVVGVRFKKAGKIYYFDPGEIEIETGQAVIVETARGVEYGKVVVGPKEVTEDEIVLPLKQVLRVATKEDTSIHNENQTRTREAFEICVEKIKEHKLDMKLIDVEYTFDNNKVIFYFTADGRVDFRELVKDLAAVFRTRIELRQIGVRDEAKMVNGIGPCGFGLCCANWLGDFAPVSIRMAKDQNLSLNPTKISGICGRLMCCLRYEHDNYVQIRSELPKKNEQVWVRDGKAVVVDNIILKEAIKTRLIVNPETGELGEDIIVAGRGEWCKEGGSCHTSGNCPQCLHTRKEEEVEEELEDAFEFDFSKLRAFEEMMPEEEKRKADPKKGRNRRRNNRRPNNKKGDDAKGGPDKQEGKPAGKPQGGKQAGGQRSDQKRNDGRRSDNRQRNQQRSNQRPGQKKDNRDGGQKKDQQGRQGQKPRTDQKQRNDQKQNREGRPQNKDGRRSDQRRDQKPRNDNRKRPDQRPDGKPRQDKPKGDQARPEGQKNENRNPNYKRRRIRKPSGDGGPKPSQNNE